MATVAVYEIKSTLMPLLDTRGSRYAAFSKRVVWFVSVCTGLNSDTISKFVVEKSEICAETRDERMKQIMHSLFFYLFLDIKAYFYFYLALRYNADEIISNN